MASAKRIGEVLTKLKLRFPRREGTNQWNLQQMHGAFKMGTLQIYCHGNGDGWGSLHGEKMHQFVFTRLGHNTQRRYKNFATKLAD